ncbi:GNAT family N-acetyltransferase [Elioraea thermophila]|uniref:GNAT family N-acetyltransferase n=1 Tax=Elioraea thermophila TaxID=2185104 RepID=UPI000DF1799F|nr:GNAT family protein [Elioraea thermophila]
MTALPLGPAVDDTPRPLPARIAHAGRSVRLEPLGPSHAADLWLAAAGAEASWTYLSYGPFESETALRRHLARLAARHDPLFFAVLPTARGGAAGWISFMEMRPDDADIEIGHIWFPPVLARSRAATEAIAILMRHALDDLGYRRLTWKCDALNAASRRAAERLGFTFEGIHRNHRIVKGRSRDTAWYSIIDAEWLLVRDALAAWLDDANFDEDGQRKRSLAAIRAELARAR